MEPFKNIFNKKSIKEFSDIIKKNAKGKFDQKEFLKEVYAEFENLEMKDRVRLISNSLFHHLTGTYKTRINILISSLSPENSSLGITDFLAWPLLQYVEDYGLDDFETSFKAMNRMTRSFSAEFAIRPFLIKDDKAVFKILNKWKKDSNKHIRRLCSEGTRPNLPWGLKVNSIHEDLNRGLKLIGSLKDDPEEYVRRSVANHLNDISRIDENLMLKTAENWSKSSPSMERLWVIRHATRSLLKNGHPRALKLHGYNPKIKTSIKKLKLDKAKITEGDSFQLSFQLQNTGPKREKILIDYVIHYLKKDGSYSQKPFRLKDGSIKAGEELIFDKKINFKRVTTRTHYSGVHHISLQINGQSTGQKSFKLSV